MPEFYQGVCPLWVLERGKPDLIGSSTLLLVEQARFLITAAHVIDAAMSRALLVGNPRGFRQIGGSGKLTKLPISGLRSADQDDTAVIALDEDTASFIEEANAPLPIQYTDGNNSSSPGKLYEFFGCPWRKVDSAKPRIFGPNIYKFKSGSVAKADYDSLGLSPHKHIAVELHLKKVTDGQGRAVTAPCPEGMSGGPVWSFIPINRDGQQMWTRRLAGITIEYRSKTQTLIGVRINAALECIRIMIPSLSPSIPATPKTT